MLIRVVENIYFVIISQEKMEGGQRERGRGNMWKDESRIYL